MDNTALAIPGPPAPSGRTRPSPDLDPALRVVALGGGTGLPILLRGLKDRLYRPGNGRGAADDPRRLTAVVTVTDDGGSSGRLRRACGTPPPGDIRNCLLALAEGDPLLVSMFAHRFNGAGRSEITGHSLGNLMLTALASLEGEFGRAVARAGSLLRVRGRVLPATTDDVTLRAVFEDGSDVAGESRIAGAGRPIRKVVLEPARVRPLPEACAAIEAATCIVLAPGSLYTSLIPILLVPGIVDAVRRSGARVILVMNLMTEPGETDGFGAGDFVRALRRHAPRLPVHAVLLNNAPIPRRTARRYAATRAVPVPPQPDRLRSHGCRPVVVDLLARGGAVRHDPGKLAAAVLLAAGPRQA